MHNQRRPSRFLDRPRRFLFVLNNLCPAGAELQALTLARQLQAAGHKPAVLAVGLPGSLSDMCRDAGIPAWHEPFENAFDSRYARRYCWKMWRLLWRFRPHVVLPYTSLPNFYCGIAHRWTPARLCVWNQRNAGLDRFSYDLERRAVQRTRVFVSNSQVGADFLTGTLQVPPRRVHLVRNAVAMAPRHDRLECRNELGLDASDFVACMVANVQLKKDHATLLDAWEQVVQRCHEIQKRPILLLAGAIRPECVELQRRVEQGPLAGYVRFLGLRTDIPRVLSATDLGVFSSHSEGTPNGVLECMAAGLPLVATDIPGIRECLGAEQGTYLCPPQSATAFAERILKIASRPEPGRMLGDANREHVRTHFAPEALGPRILELVANEIDRNCKRGAEAYHPGR